LKLKTFNELKFKSRDSNVKTRIAKLKKRNWTIL